jgi:pSer/pThr/pTyr-binding forkhead associated (FHA) protein
MRSPDPGRYLAVDDGDQVVLMTLRAGMTRIGRSASADIAFDDSSVSRHHAAVMTRMDGSVEVLDDGSLNGTYVNGERVRRQVLQHGDVLTVGARSLRYLEVRIRRGDMATEELEPDTGIASAAAA